MSTMSESRMKTWDYVSMLAIVAMSSCLGVYHLVASRKQKMTKDFLIANKDINIVAIMLSISGTVMSAVAILGYPAEVYTNGILYSWCAFFTIVSSIITSFLHLPVLYNLGTSSVYEYLECRFNKFIRLCASFLFFLQLIFYSACVIYAPAITLELVIGIPLWASVASIGVVCVLYTSLGGIKTVVWMDACQFIVMIVICLAIFIKGTIDVGGLTEMWRISSEGKRTDFFVPSSSKESSYSTWTMLSLIYAFIGTGCTNQMMMQRFLSTKSLNKARITSIGGAVLNSIIYIICCICGLVIYVRYHTCDPLLSGKVTSRDQMIPFYVLEITSAFEGLMGVFVAGIICATLSTLSSNLNSAAALTMADFIRPCQPKLTESSALKLSKIITMLYGVLCVGLVALIANAEGLITMVFAIGGLGNGPIITIFTIGMLLPWVNNIGATLGLFSGFLIGGWAFVGRMITRPYIPTAPMDTIGCDFNKSIYGNESWASLSMLSNNTAGFSKLTDESTDHSGLLYFYSLSSFWYYIWSFGTGLPVAVIVSLLTGLRDPESVDPKLIFPFVTRFIRRLKKSPQRRLSFFEENSQYIKCDRKNVEIIELRGDTPLDDPQVIDETVERTEEIAKMI